MPYDLAQGKISKCSLGNLLNPSEERLFSMNPELLRERLEAQGNQTHVIIDEIQKVPKILDVVHGLIEEKKQVQFILTGSSSRKIKQTGTNLLAGRALWKNFHPFIGCERKDQFSLEKALTTGLVPLIWTSSDPKQKLDAYVDLYLSVSRGSESRSLGSAHWKLFSLFRSHGLFPRLRFESHKYFKRM
jgi:predicted AAA+ superfamily ATPase